MALVHNGRPGSKPIHPRFTEAHRPAAEAEHTAACTIRHPGGTEGALNATTGRKTVTPHPAHYTGPCSATYLTDQAVPQGGEETLPTMQVEVAIAVDAAPDLAVDDVLVVTDVGPHGDPSLAGVSLIVDAIARDSIALETVLRCRENQS